MIRILMPKKRLFLWPNGEPMLAWMLSYFSASRKCQQQRPTVNIIIFHQHLTMPRAHPFKKLSWANLFAREQMLSPRAEENEIAKHIRHAGRPYEHLNTARSPHTAVKVNRALVKISPWKIWIKCGSSAAVIKWCLIRRYRRRLKVFL